MAKSFTSAEEEIQYWKDRVAVLEKEAAENKEEFEDFQISSRELELELETQLEQSEAKIRDFRSLTNRLEQENDHLKDKLEQCTTEYHAQVNELQTELAEIKAIKDQFQKYVRELEQQNDDLERAKRSTLASLEDFEGRLNAAIERNAFLESELDEKESLKAAVQRMKDETRDLRSELKILTTKTVEPISGTPDNDRNLMKLKLERNNNSFNGSSNGGKSSPDSNKHAAEALEKDTILDTPPSSSKSSPSHNLTPSARLSALNIVGDLLRKVGALELKLSSCRNIVKAENGSTTPTGVVPVERRRSSRSATPNN